MKISQLEFDKIRSFQAPAALKLSPNINIITGVNGAGKSTILEALRYALSGRLDAHQVCRHVESPFLVSSRLELSPAGGGVPVFSFCSDQAQLTRAGATLRREAREAAFELSAGVVDYLVACSVEDMNWMFRKPAEIYATANEILALEAAAKFAAEMLTQGNRMAKIRENLVAVLEGEKGLKSILSQEAIGKRGLECCKQASDVFKTCQMRFERILEIGDVSVETDVTEFDQEAYSEVIAQKARLSNLVRSQEVEIATAKKTIGKGTGVSFDEQRLEELNEKIENAYIGCNTGDEWIDDLMAEFQAEGEMQAKERISDSIEEAFHRVMRSAQAEATSAEQEEQVISRQLIHNEREKEQLSIELEKADVFENLTKDKERLLTELEECDLKLEAPEQRLETFKGELSKINTEIATLNTALNELKRYTDESDSFDAQIKEYNLTLEQDAQLVEKAFGPTCLNYSSLQDIKRTTIPRFIKDIGRFKFGSASDFFQQAEEVLERSVTDLKSLAHDVNNVLLSSSLSDEFSLLSSELLSFVSKKETSPDFIKELEKFLHEYAEELASLASDTARTDELHVISRFSEYLGELRATFDFEDEEQFGAVLQRYSVSVQLLIDYYSCLHNAPTMDSSMQTAISEAAIYVPELSNTLHALEKRDLAIEQVSVGTQFTFLLPFALRTPPELESAIAERECGSRAVESDILSLSGTIRSLLDQKTEEQQEIAELDRRIRGIRLELPVAEMRSKAAQCDNAITQLQMREAASEARVSAAQKAIEHYSNCGIGAFADIGEAAKTVAKMLGEQRFEQEHAKIAVLQREIQSNLNGLSSIEKRIGWLEHEKQLFEETSKRSALASELQELAGATGRGLREFEAIAEDIFGLHEQIEQLANFRLKKETRAAAKRLCAFGAPFSSHKGHFQLLNDYIVQIQQAFVQMAGHSDQLKKANQLLKAAVKEYASDAVSTRLGREFLTASNSLKTAIKDFEDNFFQRANAHFSEFWRQVYMRKDVENVRIFRERSKATLELQGLIRGEWRPLKNFISAGEQALCSILFRLSLIRCLSLPIALFCSDEPTNFLDEGNEEELARTLAAFGVRSQLEFVIVTHSERFAEKIIAESGGEARVIRVVNGSAGSSIEMDRI